MLNSPEKLYEFTYLSTAHEDADIAKLKNDIDALAVKHGGSIRQHGEAAKRQLAYPIKNMLTAHVVSEHLTFTPEQKTAFAKDLAFNEKILRYQLLATSEKFLNRLREKRVAIPAFSREVGKKTLKRADGPQREEKSVEERSANVAEIEKKLDEILGREF